MKVAAFQFRGSNSIESNLKAIERSIEKASKEDVRFLITQECALCGYPPVETEKIGNINFELMNYTKIRIKQLAAEKNMYIGLGLIRQNKDKYFNSIEMVTPNDDLLSPYNKRALWGWDLENYTPGEDNGIYEIDGIKLGVRICYEVRFPEYFRELLKENVQIGFVSFCDVSKEENSIRYDTIKSHLITRAVENVMYIISANSISNFQTAPTCIINPDGQIIQILPKDKEALLTFEFENVEINFGRKGRIKKARELLGI